MPAFSGQFDWTPGLIWDVAVVPDSIPSDKTGRPGRLHMCRALVDTGATSTCISKSVAAELGIEPTGKVDMQTAGGVVDVNVYSVRIGFPFGRKANQSGETTTQIQFINAIIQAPEFDPGNSNYRALIGRDILRIGVLSMSYDGHFSFAY